MGRYVLNKQAYPGYMTNTSMDESNAERCNFCYAPESLFLDNNNGTIECSYCGEVHAYT